MNTPSNLSHQLELASTQIDLFYQLLLDESKSLKNLDPSPLTELIKLKNEHAQQVETLFAQLLTDHPNLFNDKNLHLTYSKATFERVDKLKYMLGLCSELNQQNGIKIAALSNINNGLIDQLTANNNKVNLYGSSGKTTKTDYKNAIGKA